VADDGYVAIHRTTDVAEGELMAEMLRREGIAARFHRVSSSLIGVPMFLIEMTVDVPIDSEARARAVLHDLEYVGADGAAKSEEEEGGGDEADDGAPGEPAVSGRKPVLAAGFAFFVPGGGHLYARRPWTTLVLTLGVLVGFAIAIATRGAFLLELAVSIWLAVIGCDAVAGIRAVRAGNRGEQRPRGAQLSFGIRLLGLAIVIGAGTRLATAAPRLYRTWQLAKYKISCTDRALVVKNGDGKPHKVHLSDLKVAAYPPFGADEPQIYDIAPGGPIERVVVAEGRTSVTVYVASGLARRCGFRTLPGDKAFAPEDAFGSHLPSGIEQRFQCGFLFAFDAGEATAEGEPLLEATGACFPSDGVDSETAGGMMLGR